MTLPLFSYQIETGITIDKSLTALGAYFDSTFILFVNQLFLQNKEAFALVRGRLLSVQHFFLPTIDHSLERTGSECDVYLKAFRYYGRSTRPQVFTRVGGRRQFSGRFPCPQGVNKTPANRGSEPTKKRADCCGRGEW